MRNTTLCQKFLDNEIKTSPLVIFKKRQEECEELAGKIEEEKLHLKKAKRDFQFTGIFQHRIIDKQIEIEEGKKSIIMEGIQSNNLFPSLGEILRLAKAQRTRNEIQKKFAKKTQLMEDAIQRKIDKMEEMKSEIEFDAKIRENLRERLQSMAGSNTDERLGSTFYQPSGEKTQSISFYDAYEGAASRVKLMTKTAKKLTDQASSFKKKHALIERKNKRAIAQKEKEI